MKNDELIEHHLIHTGVLIGVLNAIPKGGTVEDVETIMSSAMWELLKKGLLDHRSGCMVAPGSSSRKKFSA